jgi:dihydrodipicolinate synthase/N-acetylneuraminate lyase
VLNGTDRLFSLALQHSAAGCITALANLVSPDLRRVWEGHQTGMPDLQAQSRLDAARSVSDAFAPAPPFIKAMLAHFFGLPRWAVRPPLLPMTDDALEAAAAALQGVLNA